MQDKKANSKTGIMKKLRIKHVHLVGFGGFYDKGEVQHKDLSGKLKQDEPAGFHYKRI